MNQVTGSDDVEEVKVTGLPDKLEFDDQTTKIFKQVQLDSKSVVFAGLFLLELYYNKTYGKPLSTKYIGKPKPMEIYVFGSSQIIIESINKLIEQLQKIKDFGQMQIRTKSSGFYNDKHFIIAKGNPDIINFTWENFYREINVWSINCKNTTELMGFFESGNEMLYWAHDTGLVSSPFGKIAMETKQIVPNVKNCKTISNQKIFELVCIGMDPQNYISSSGFVHQLCPQIDEAKYYGKILCEEINESTIENYVIKIANTNYQSWIELDGLEQQLTVTNFIIDDLVHPINKSSEYNCLMFTGIFKQTFVVKGNIYVVLAIPDNQVANKFKNIVKFCFERFQTTYGNDTPIKTWIVDSNYLKPDEKYLSYLSEYELLHDYSHESNMVICCELQKNIKIVDITNKSILIDRYGKVSYKVEFADTTNTCDLIKSTIVPNTVLTIWSNLIIRNYSIPNQAGSTIVNTIGLIAFAS